MRYWLVIFSLFIMLMSLTLIDAAAPFVSTTTTGIQIEHPISDAIKVNTNHTFHFHIYNATSGLPFTNNSDIVCIFHLYNPEGDHLMKVEPVSKLETFDREQIVVGGNFTELGQYAYVFQCNNSAIGGFYEHEFDVTPSGTLYTVSQSITYLALIGVLVLLLVILLYFAITIEPGNIKGGEGQLIAINWMKYLKIFCWAMAYVMLVGIAFVGWNLATVFLFFTSLANLFKVVYTILMTLAIPVFIVYIILNIVAALHDKDIYDKLARGLTVYE